MSNSNHNGTEPLLVQHSVDIVDETTQQRRSIRRIHLFNNEHSSTPSPTQLYISKFIYMGLWLAILMSLYCMNRLLVRSNLPYDGILNESMLELTRDINQIFQLGGILGWFVGIYQPGKLWGMLGKPWFSIVLVGISPLYSWISNLDALRHSLADMSRWTMQMTIVVCIGAAAIIGVMLRLAVLSYHKYGFKGLAIFICSRLILLGWLFIEVLLLSDEFKVQIKMHLHHYIILWWVATWAEFDGDIISETVLAFSTGVFMQGVGAYSAAPVFFPEGSSIMRYKCTD